MEENLNFGLEQEPAAEVAATPVKRVNPRLLIAGAIVLGIALIIGIVFAVLSAKTPLQKTMEAVFPSAELWGELMTEGGTLTINGELADDLLGEGLQDPFCFSADYAFSHEGTLVTLTAGAEDDRVDLSLLQDEKGLQMYSDRLLGDKTYGILFEGLMDAIDASPFAPKSGTAYELPRDIYDMIDQYAEMLEEEPQTYEHTALVFAKATEAMMNMAQTYSKNETVSLVGGDTRAKVYSCTFYKESFDAFADVLTEEWENNDAFRAEIESVDPDGQIVSFISNVIKELELRDESFFKGITLTYKYAVKGGYLVYADCLITDLSGNEENSVFAAIKFTDKPKKDPSYDIEFSVTQGEFTHPRYTFTYRKSDDGKKEEWSYYDTLSEPAEYTATAEYGADGAFALTVKHEIDVDVTDRCELFTLWQFDLNGTLRKTDDSFALGIDEMKYEDKDGKTLFHMSDSSFGICLESGKPSIKRRENEINLLGMSVGDLNELGATLEGELIKAFESIGDKLGAQLVRDTYMPNALAMVKAEGHLCDYAYDSKSGRLFFAYDLGTSGEIWMYDAKTMELLDKLMLDDPVLAIDADGGYLAFVYEKKAQQTAYVHSSTDMTYIAEFDYMDHNTFYPEMEYPGDILVDGGRLIYITGDQHVSLYFTDIKTGETVRQNQRFYRGKLSLDRENHVVAVLDNYLSACDLAFFSTLSCDRIEQIDRFDMDAQYLSGPAHFDGYAFWATADEWYTPNGNSGTLATALSFETNGGLAQVVYRDENLIVTLETGLSGKLCTAFYRADGTYCDSADELYLWMRPIDENHFLAAYQDGNKTVFAYCELAEGKVIG